MVDCVKRRRSVKERRREVKGTGGGMVRRHLCENILRGERAEAGHQLPLLDRKGGTFATR